MALPDLPTNSVVLVSFIGNCNGNRIINTFHYRCAVVPAPATEYDNFLDKLFLGINAAGGIIPTFLDTQASNYTLEKVRIQPVYPDRLRYRNYLLLSSGTWAADSQTVNQTSACSIKRVTNYVGQSGVGRVQILVPDGQFSGGNIVDVNGWIAKANIFAVAMGDDVVTAAPVMTWKPCLYGPGYVTTGVYDVVDWEVETTIRTMHRRTNFLGE